MKRGFLWRAVLTVVAIVSIVPIFVPQFSSNFPFSVETKPGIGYVLRQASGMALPEGLEIDDVIALDQMSAETRANLIIINNNGNVPIGLEETVVIHRGDELIRFPVKSIPNDGASSTANRLSNYPLLLGILALALVTLWRGRDWTAWGLTAFAIGLCLKQIDVWPAGGWLGFWAEITSRLIMWMITLPGLYITAEALVGKGLSLRMRHGFRAVALSGLLLNIATVLGRIFDTVFWGSTGWLASAVPARLSGIALIFMPLLLLVAGYRNSAAPERLRIRWVLWSTGLLGASVVSFVVVPDDSIYARVAATILQSLSFFGYLYAVLRHRLVDVSFVIDRTLVFGLTTGFVVGIFALLEQLIEKLAIGNDASVLLQAGATLVIALVLNRVHRRVESLVDRLLFQRQHRSIERLHEFTRECVQIEEPDRLLPMATERIAAAMAGTSVAIYGRRVDRHVRLVTNGGERWPSCVAAGDALLAKLQREAQQATALADTTGSALGADGWAFPMTVRGELSGIVVCIPPPAVQLSPDQRAALAELAQRLGIAQYMLQAAEHERFIAQLAAGEIDSPLERARRLLRGRSA